jgi:hypothetical protein
LRGAWNLRGTRDTKIQVIEVSVSSLYYLFSVVIDTQYDVMMWEEQENGSQAAEASGSLFVLPT